MNQFKQRTLNNPPYIQLAIDIPDQKQVKEVFEQISSIISPQLLLEIGTPLLKNEGLVTTVPMFRQFSSNSYIIADLKTLDVGKLEVNLCHQIGADACVVSGLAPPATIKSFISECATLGIDSWLDTLGTDLTVLTEKIKTLEAFPDVIVVHRGIDEELSGKSSPWGMIQKIKSITPGLVASAGGINLSNIQEPRKFGADIFIVGRAIYQSKNPRKELEAFYSIIDNFHK
ncbi:MAG: orotidine 5'-phosphate decarboxylase / HUMPS family protein [Candidatus Hodarchaeales archaeon]